MTFAFKMKNKIIHKLLFDISFGLNNIEKDSYSVILILFSIKFVNDNLDPFDFCFIFLNEADTANFIDQFKL